MTVILLRLCLLTTGDIQCTDSHPPTATACHAQGHAWLERAVAWARRSHIDINREGGPMYVCSFTAEPGACLYEASPDVPLQFVVPRVACPVH